MSFPALYLACQAVATLPTLDDDEFGVSWSDLDAIGLDVNWVIYEAMTGATIFGVRSVDVAG
jgi:hypothetical protein